RTGIKAMSQQAVAQRDIFEKDKKPAKKPKALVTIEKKLWDDFPRIAGVDEAGRGPLAGPVVAACCILPKGKLFPKIKDSKALNDEERKKLFEKITHDPEIFWQHSI